MRRHRIQEGPAALDLVEEAAHLLRRAPASGLGLYYIGAVPFVIQLLFFWSDMSRGAMAFRRCGIMSAGLALLYVWMRAWQAYFCAGMRALRTGSPAPVWSVREFMSVAVGQLRWTPWSLFALAPSLLATIPFGWVHAYHQNLVCLQEQPAADSGSIPRRAWSQGLLWTRQNHFLMFQLAVLGLFVWINLAVTLGVLPSLVKTLFGVASAFTRYKFWVFDSTFVAAVTALTYLALDPLVKTVHVLRCYHGESLRTGRDLRVDLRRVAPLRSATLALVVVTGILLLPESRAAFVATAEPVAAFTNAMGTAAMTPEARQLDATIERVLRRPEFAWRMPRDARPKTDRPEGAFIRMMRDLGMAIQDAIDWCRRLFKKIWDWFHRSEEHDVPPMRVRDSRSGGWLGTQPVLHALWGVLALLGIVGAFLAYRAWRLRRMRNIIAAQEAAPRAAAPDIEDERLTAEHLPAGEWLAWAEEWRRAGEFRKALRAYFLATLAALGDSGLIALTPLKSNLDYRRELGRRTRGGPPAEPAFAESVALFERGWYGRHPVTDDLLERMQTIDAELRRMFASPPAIDRGTA